MRKVLVLVILCCQIVLANDFEMPDADRGQVFYKYFVAPYTNINGAIFAKLYTKKEWEDVFTKDGERFFQEFVINKNSITKNNLSHIKAFCVRYAKDSDVSPNCSE